MPGLLLSFAMPVRVSFYDKDPSQFPWTRAGPPGGAVVFDVDGFASYGPGDLFRLFGQADVFRGEGLSMDMWDRHMEIADAYRSRMGDRVVFPKVVCDALWDIMRRDSADWWWPESSYEALGDDELDDFYYDEVVTMCCYAKSGCPIYFVGGAGVRSLEVPEGFESDWLEGFLYHVAESVYYDWQGPAVR